MIDLVYSFFKSQQDKLQDAKIEFNDTKVDQAHAETLSLQLQHERLKLVTMAMWELIRDHTGLMESDLKKYVEMVDLKDGKRDGRVKRFDDIKTCPSCKRTILRSSLTCAYCGKPIPLKSVFDGV